MTLLRSWGPRAAWPCWGARAPALGARSRFKGSPKGRPLTRRARWHAASPSGRASRRGELSAMRRRRGALRRGEDGAQLGAGAVAELRCAGEEVMPRGAWPRSRRSAYSPTRPARKRSSSAMWARSDRPAWSWALIAPALLPAGRASRAHGDCVQRWAWSRYVASWERCALAPARPARAGRRSARLGRDPGRRSCRRSG